MTDRMKTLRGSLLLWLGASLLEASIATAQEGVPFLMMLPGSAVPYGILALLAIPIWRFCLVLRERRPPSLAAAAAHAVMAVLVVAVWQGAYLGLLYLVLGRTGLSPLLEGGLWYLLSATLQYGLLVAGILFVQTARLLRDQERRETELRVLAREAELRALKAQFRPHFFFNVLNSLYALIEIDPPRAQEMLDRISRLMRQTLDVADDAWVPLEWEMDSIRAYLEIERIRLGDRLEVQVDVDETLRTLPVPPLLLQPLVENAVKHGIAPHGGSGRVAVSARPGNGGLLLSVRDSGPGPDHDPGPDDGRGLSMTRERLEHLYGGAFRMGFRRLEPSGYEVSIDLPGLVAGGGEET